MGGCSPIDVYRRMVVCDCWHGHVEVVDLGPCKSSTSVVWERAIREAGERRLIVYTDGSRDDDGRVGGGWHAPRNGARSVRVGNVTTVWDGEVAGIHQALRIAPEVHILVPSDSTAELQVVKRAARSGHGCLQECGILLHSRTYYCSLFSLCHMFIIFVISY